MQSPHSMRSESSSAPSDALLESDQNLHQFDKGRNYTQPPNCKYVHEYEALGLELSGQANFSLGLQEGEHKGDPEEKSVAHNAVQILHTRIEDQEREAVEQSEEGDDDPQSLVLLLAQEGSDSNHDRDSDSEHNVLNVVANDYAFSLPESVFEAVVQVAFLNPVESAAEIAKVECPEDDLEDNQDDGQNHKDIRGRLAVLLQVSSGSIGSYFKGSCH